MSNTVAVAAQRTMMSFSEELPRLLRERSLSLRELGRRVGVGGDHLSRVLRGDRALKPTAHLTRRVALALDLPDDYFPEARLEFIVVRLREDDRLRDEIYDQLRSGASADSSST